MRSPGATHLVIGFQHLADADRFLTEFRERLQKFGLELHPEKTRRIEFGRFAEINRKKRGEGKPETFDFLGFTHISGKDRNRSYTVKRKTISKRLRDQVLEVIEVEKGIAPDRRRPAQANTAGVPPVHEVGWRSAARVSGGRIEGCQTPSRTIWRGAVS